MIALQCITRIEFLHSRDFIHRDIKPENFLIGIGKKAATIYTIDFGLAKRYKDPKTGSHIVFKEGKGMTGTARYASLNAHLGYEQSRRDDLEAIGYMVCYFLRKGHLPWMGLKGKKKDKYENITESKRITPFEELLDGFPNEFVKYMKYCRNLAFEQKPDYSYLKKLFESYLAKHSYEENSDFDWVLRKQLRLKEINANNGIHEEEKESSPIKSPDKKRQGS